MSAPSAGQRYLTGVTEILNQILSQEWGAIETAGHTVAASIRGGGIVHVFGTGHSHMLAEEMFYRAGGLAAINPILIDSLMLHDGAENATRLERLQGLAETIFPEVPVSEGDTLIVASNSGGNPVCAEMAQLCLDAGASVIAIISRKHAASSAMRRPDCQLADIAHTVIDNHGAVGDASIQIPSLTQRVAPTSTVAGAAIINAIAAEAIAILAADGGEVEVFTSSNVTDGDTHNANLLTRYRSQIRAL